MTLATYKNKRSFNKTPEPQGGKTDTAALRFVIQKHDASHLHYDFRLEMDGVLKSWAVPKGPSMDPDIKRLAMMVEDHPYDYRTFEGIIPEGNYGAGTVIVWDEGTYELEEKTKGTKRDQEKKLLSDLKKGKLTFTMHGKKLKGNFVLVKTSSRGENTWLLFKMHDKYATTKDILKNEKSVQSGKTLNQIEKTSNKIWISNKSSTVKRNTNEIPELKKIPVVKNNAVDKGKKSSFPGYISPMLASVADKPFSSDEWLYEIKWDGYRAVAAMNKGKTDLRSRNNLSFAKFKPVMEACNNWQVNAVVDGEIVCVNEKGVPDFQQLQAWQKTGKGDLKYYVFDLMWYDGKDLTHLPLTERKEILKNIIPLNSLINYSDHIIKDGEAFFELSLKKDLEGIMAKHMQSTYSPGLRTKQWLKIKNNKRMEAVICGYTAGRNSRKYFGSLILGTYKKDKLVYIGNSGSGFDEASLKEIFNRLEPLVTEKCPFDKKPKTDMKPVWVKPKLVCEIKFTEWTRDESLRHPIFMGLRNDKNATGQKNEVIVKAGVKTRSTVVKNKTVRTNTVSKKKEKTEMWLKKDSTEETVILNSHSLKLTNLDKIYWPDEKYTKRDLLNYYSDVMEYILPYVKNRPQSLNRYPNGIAGQSFYQKNVAGKVPGWIQTHDYVSESDSLKKEFLVLTDEASLMYIVNLGCIEINPWHSRTSDPENPDWCVIDLDPDTNSFDEVMEVARLVKEVLDSAKVNSFCKTSGSTGIHIYIPLGGKYSYEQSRQFAELIVSIVHKELPGNTSIIREPAKRKGKIYLDFLQNRHIQTIAAPYSVRPKPGATVSAPLHWEELKKGLSIQDFNIFNMMKRIKAEGDLFKGVLGKGMDMMKALERLS